MKHYSESANYGRTYPLHGEALERKKTFERLRLSDTKRARIQAQREASKMAIESTVQLSQSTKDQQQVGVSYRDWMNAKKAARLQRGRLSRSVRP